MAGRCRRADRAPGAAAGAACRRYRWQRRSRRASPGAGGGRIRSLCSARCWLAVAAYGGHLGYDWWTDGRFMVTTDDAYVQGDITILAAKMRAMSPRSRSMNNQPSSAGDVIARIDDGDYRLALAGGAGQARDAGEHDRAHRAPDRGRRRRVSRKAEAGAGRGPGRADPCRRGVRAAECSSAGPTSPASRSSTRRPAIATGRRRRSERRGRARGRAGQCRGAAGAAGRGRARGRASCAPRWPRRSAICPSRWFARRSTAWSATRRCRSATTSSPARGCAALVPLASVYVDANFKETQLAELRPGQKVRLRVDAFPDREIDGHGRERRAGLGLGVQPAAAGERHRQLHQDRAARAGAHRGAGRRAEQGMLRPGLSVVGRRSTRRTGARHEPSRAASRMARAADGSPGSAVAAARRSGGWSSPSWRWCSACSWRSWTSRSSRPRCPRSRPACRASADEISWVQTSLPDRRGGHDPAVGLPRRACCRRAAVHHLGRRLHR